MQDQIFFFCFHGPITDVQFLLFRWSSSIGQSKLRSPGYGLGHRILRGLDSHERHDGLERGNLYGVPVDKGLEESSSEA